MYEVDFWYYDFIKGNHGFWETKKFETLDEALDFAKEIADDFYYSQICSEYDIDQHHDYPFEKRFLDGDVIYHITVKQINKETA